MSRPEAQTQVPKRLQVLGHQIQEFTRVGSEVVTSDGLPSGGYLLLNLSATVAGWGAKKLPVAGDTCWPGRGKVGIDLLAVNRSSERAQGLKFGRHPEWQVMAETTPTTI